MMLAGRLPRPTPQAALEQGWLFRIVQTSTPYRGRSLDLTLRRRVSGAQLSYADGSWLLTLVPQRSNKDFLEAGFGWCTLVSAARLSPKVDATVYTCGGASQVVKSLPEMQEFQIRSLGQDTLVLLPGEFHGQRSLVSSPWGCKESDTAECLTTLMGDDTELVRTNPLAQRLTDRKCQDFLPPEPPSSLASTPVLRRPAPSSQKHKPRPQSLPVGWQACRPAPLGFA